MVLNNNLKEAPNWFYLAIQQSPQKIVMEEEIFLSEEKCKEYIEGKPSSGWLMAKYQLIDKEQLIKKWERT